MTTKNIFEELTTETEKILGGSFKIKVKTEGCNFRFENLEKERTRKAFQETVKYSLRTSKLKNFSFEEKEINDLSSLASAFLRLLYFCRKSFGEIPEDQRHFLECPSCQIILLHTIHYFVSKLNFGKVKLTGVYGEIGITILPIQPYYLSLFLEVKLFINSEVKWEIFQRYAPLFAEKEIKPERIFALLAKHTHEKQEDLTVEEFEKILKELTRSLA